MAIAFRAAGVVDADPTAATPTLPAGTAEDDILICVASATGNTAFTWPAGWTEIYAINASGTRRHEARWKRATSSESDPTITIPAANVIVAQIAGWSGCVGSGNPIDRTGTVTNQTATTLNYTAITPTVANTELVMLGCGSNNQLVSAYSGSNPAPSERFDGVTALGSTASVHLASGAKNDTTSSGARTATKASGTAAYTTLQINLLPDTTGPAVSVTSPTASQQVAKGSVLALAATATDDSGVASVQFKVDGANVGAADTSDPYGVNLDTTSLSLGDHTATAVATDTLGNPTTSNGVTFTVVSAGAVNLLTLGVG